MNVETMRKIDYWIGAPACAALTCWNAVFRRRPKEGEPRNVLIVQLSEMGSLALAYPAIRYLKSRYPGVRVHFLIFKRNRKFLEMLDLVERPEDIWTLDDSSLSAFLSSSLRFFRAARKRGIDTTLDFEIFSRASMILARLAGARRRAGFHNYLAEGLYRGNLLTHPVFYNVYKHISLNFLAMIRGLEADRGNPPALKEVLDDDLTLPKRETPPEKAEAMRRRVAEIYPNLTDETHIIVLSPFSGNLLPIRAWPAENHAVLAERLLAATEDTVVLLIGLPEARDYCRPILDRVRSPRLVDFIGKTKDIAEVIDLFNISDLFVTTDSGPPHFASMTEIPTIVLFGPECPMLYGPLGENVRTVYLGMSCSPCVSAFNHRATPCRDNQCMKQIKPDDVFEIALEQLSKTQVHEGG